MERVRRSGVKAHVDWAKNVKAALPKDFTKHAKTFEKIPIDDPKRRADKAFLEHAPTALPLPPSPKKKKGKAAAKKTAKKKRDFPALWRTDKRVKVAMAKMSDDCCVYCQSNVINHYGDVEHYKPKTLFPSLAYDWDNYFLACKACNTNKGNKWPAAAVGAYVRPDQKSPGKRFIFRPDGSMKAVAGDAEAEATCEDLKLDRPALRKYRRKHMRHTIKRLKADLKINKAMTAAEMRAYLVPALDVFSQAINQSVRYVWGKATRKI